MQFQPGDAPSQKPAVAVIQSDLEHPDLIPFLETYLRGLPAQVAQLKELLADEDLKSLSVLAHNLKGSGGLYGLMPITDAASGVERLIHAQASLDEVTTKVRSLIAVIRRVEGYCEAETPARVSAGATK